MRDKIKKRLMKILDGLYSFCKVIELIMAVIITIAILIFLAALVGKLIQTPIADPSEQLIEFLRSMLSLVIGVAILFGVRKYLAYIGPQKPEEL